MPPESPSLRANGSRERAPDDRLREAIHSAAKQVWIASSLSRYCSGVMLYCVRRWRFSDLKRLPSSRQTRYSGVIDFLTETAGFAGSSGASTRPVDTRISAA